MEAQFDSSRLNKTLEQYLHTMSSEVWPRAMNKKGFYVASKAAKNNPIKNYESVLAELMRPVTAKDENDRTKQVPVGWVLAAKRATKHWDKKQLNRWGNHKKELRLTRKRWQAELKGRLKAMLGGRKASLRFLSVGWYSVMSLLGPLIGGRYNRGPMRGSLKGSAVSARALSLSVTITSTSNARSETRGGFERLGIPPLLAAIEEETASMEKHIQDEMAKDTAWFNNAQH